MKRISVAVALALLFVMAGCKKQAPAPTQSSISDQNSRSSSISPADRQAIQDKLSAQLPSAAPGLTPGGGPVFPPNPNLDIYSVTFLWGTFFAGPGPTPTPTDWSGKLHVGPLGKLAVAAKISFDPGQDTILQTNDTTTAAWISLTGAQDIDGLSFLVAIDRTSPLTVMPQLSFTTVPVQLNLLVYRLVKFDTLILVNNHDALLMVARKLQSSNCPSGAISGLWSKANVSGDSGKFSGNWMAPDNSQSGFMSGRFWTNNDGSRAFFGQYTDMQHNPRGYLKGKWLYDDPRMCAMCGTGHGSFFGTFTNLDTVSIGSVAAEIGDMTNPTFQLDLAYKGMWKLWCPRPDAELMEQ